MKSRRSPNMDPKDRVNDQRLTEFLSEFQNLQDEENKNFFHNFCNNADLQQSIYRVLQRPREESLDILKDLCQFLLKMYRSAFGQRQSRTNFIPTSTANDMLRTRVVVLQYLPHFIYLHLIVRSGVKQRSLFKFIDAFLLSIYNSEVMEQQSYRATASSITNMPNNPLVRPLAVKVPPLSTNSCYHDSARLESEDKLDQRPSGLMFHFESWAFVETLNASSKPTVFRVLLQIFNRHIVEVSKYGLDQFVRATLKVLDCGYGLQTHPRIHLDTSVSQELLFSAYVCMYNGFQVAANQIVDMIHARASVSGCAEILLLSNSIKSLVLNSSPSQVSTSHASTPVQLAKNMITNASFRAKKMQTDIPKVQIESSDETKAMAAIVEQEEKEEEKTPSKGSENKGFNRDKLMAKLRKKTHSISDESGMLSASEKKNDKKKEIKAEKNKKQKHERPDKLEMVSEITPLVTPASKGLNGDSASAASNSSKEYDTVEKVEELIQMRKLPPETITIHSPESGTTIF